MVHILVTNDFPPKIGGIQSYLYEIYRRAPRDSAVVVTTDYAGSREFDRAFPIPVIRLGPRLLPTPWLRRRLDKLTQEMACDGVIYDPVFPLGAIARSLDVPYCIVTHGAEATVAGAIPGVRHGVGETLSKARGVIAAGSFPERATLRIAPGARVINVPPGVDFTRFRPCPTGEREPLRARLMMDPMAKCILFVSRLVPRKGADTLIRAVAGWKGVEVHIVGDGRDRDRLEGLAHKLSAPVVFQGRVSSCELVQWYQVADVCAFPVRSRWAGLEQEGFGMVVSEAEASGVPVVATANGGVPDAVVSANPNLLDESATVAEVRSALVRALIAPGDSSALRDEAVWRFNWDDLASQYHGTVASWFGSQGQCDPKFV